VRIGCVVEFALSNQAEAMLERSAFLEEGEVLIDELAGIEQLLFD
jgi:hypothetical protein